MPRLSEFVILVDTREKRPWKLVYPCLTTKLDAGDYTIQGAEKQLRIERKGSIGEFVNNCSKGDWKRFRDALRKLSRYKHKAIICEFEMRDIFAERWPGGITGDAILARISEITLEIGIPIIFAGKKGKSVASAFMLKYYNRNKR